MNPLRRFLQDGQYLEVSADRNLPLDYIILELSDGGDTIPQARLNAEDVRHLISTLQTWLTERQE
jgi:hypothetical protein